MKDTLIDLARFFKTDKIDCHNYIQHYQLHFEKFIKQKFNLLEIGVGGYAKVNEGGNSLRMWKAYFPNADIYSIDIYDKSALQEDRIKILKGSQTDEKFLNEVFKNIEFDIIIDDGSHVSKDVIMSFQILFPKLKDGGIYVVEDTQTSYWSNWGGSMDLLNGANTMNYFKSLTDSLNNKEFINPNYKQTYFDKKIISMHFYHNLIFIYKGDNNENSNMVINNKFK